MSSIDMPAGIGIAHRGFDKPMRNERFLVISALIFAANATTTIDTCMSMSAIDNMPIPND